MTQMMDDSAVNYHRTQVLDGEMIWGAYLRGMMKFHELIELGSKPWVESKDTLNDESARNGRLRARIRSDMEYWTGMSEPVMVKLPEEWLHRLNLARMWMDQNAMYGRYRCYYYVVPKHGPVLCNFIIGPVV